MSDYEYLELPTCFGGTGKIGGRDLTPIADPHKEIPDSLDVPLVIRTRLNSDTPEEQARRIERLEGKSLLKKVVGFFRL